MNQAMFTEIGNVFLIVEAKFMTKSVSFLLSQPLAFTWLSKRKKVALKICQRVAHSKAVESVFGFHSNKLGRERKKRLIMSIMIYKQIDK